MKREPISFGVGTATVTITETQGANRYIIRWSVGFAAADITPHKRRSIALAIKEQARVIMQMNRKHKDSVISYRVTVKVLPCDYLTSLNP